MSKVYIIVCQGIIPEILSSVFVSVQIFGHCIHASKEDEEPITERAIRVPAS